MKELSFEKMETIDGGSMGQDTMNCVIDAYSNKGWISAWAFIQTAFIPGTAVVITLVCAAHNL